MIDLNQIQNDYRVQSEQTGTAGGNVQEITYEDGMLTFTEDDGDVIQMKSDDLSDTDLNSLKAQFGIDIKADEAKDVAAADNVLAAADVEDVKDTKELDAKKAELDKLQDEWNALEKTSKELEEEINKISEKIEKGLSDALKQQEEITKEEKERIEDVVAEKIAQFKKDVQEGKNVTSDDLLADISEAINSGGAFDAGMATVRSQMEALKADMSTMETLLGTLKDVKTDMAGIQSEMNSVQSEISDLEAAESAADSDSSCCTPPPCDPIGFVDEDGTKFEFVIDKDGNGDLSSAKEFLGADDNYDELIALDTEGAENGASDGVVSRKELEQTEGLMVLVTTSDGKQELKTLQEAFGDQDISIDLNSMNKYDGQDKVSDINGQQLLADFDITVGDKTHKGYSTLDSAEYLEENYTFTDGLGLTAQPVEDPEIIGADAEIDPDDEAAQAREDSLTHLDAFHELRTQNLESFKERFDVIEEILDIDAEVIESTKDLTLTVAEFVANQALNKYENAEDEAKAKAAIVEKAEKAAEEEAKAQEKAAIEGADEAAPAIDAAPAEDGEAAVDGAPVDKAGDYQSFEEILEEILGADKAKSLDEYAV